MAIIICPECGARISDSAPRCPSCGAPVRPLRSGTHNISHLPDSVSPKISSNEYTPKISNQDRIIHNDRDKVVVIWGFIATTVITLFHFIGFFRMLFHGKKTLYYHGVYSGDFTGWFWFDLLLVLFEAVAWGIITYVLILKYLRDSRSV